MKSVKYLEQLKKQYELKNDSALAVELGINKSAVSQYMNGKRVMEEEVCLRVALALDVDPLKVLMAAGIDRAERTGQQSLWEVFSRRTATTATLAIVCSVNLFLTPTPAKAAPVLKDVGSLFILCQIALRKLRRTLKALFCPTAGAATA